MIPKIIHYCWLSNDPIPTDMQKCIASWKKCMPDYEYIKWDFSRFDISQSCWVKDAFENRKYAFAADYIRLYALYTMGGIYMDMDVEVLKPFDDILKYSYFLCVENRSKDLMPEMATLGAEKECWWIGLLLNYYGGRPFIKDDGLFDTKPLPQITKDYLQLNGISFKEIGSLYEGDWNDKSHINILPYSFFSPKSYETQKLLLTDNTYSIHRFSGSWIPWEQRVEKMIWNKLRLKPHRVMWHVDRWLAKYFHIKR